MTLSVPVPLADHHELGEFSSGITALDDWLKKRARTNQAGGASRTY
ncbi:GNAT family N-acetyltransferase, partial [Mesorhizobium sp. M7A.F.Ca.US.002.01.1.1]